MEPTPDKRTKLGVVLRFGVFVLVAYFSLILFTWLLVNPYSFEIRSAA